jgi:hypothetical protein
MPQRTNDATSSSKRAEEGLHASTTDAVRTLLSTKPQLIEG